MKRQRIVPNIHLMPKVYKSQAVNMKALRRRFTYLQTRIAESRLSHNWIGIISDAILGTFDFGA